MVPPVIDVGSESPQTRSNLKHDVDDSLQPTSTSLKRRNVSDDWNSSHFAENRSVEDCYCDNGIRSKPIATPTKSKQTAAPSSPSPRLSRARSASTSLLPLPLSRQRAMSRSSPALPIHWGHRRQRSRATFDDLPLPPVPSVAEQERLAAEWQSKLGEAAQVVLVGGGTRFVCASPTPKDSFDEEEDAGIVAPASSPQVQLSDALAHPLPQWNAWNQRSLQEALQASAWETPLQQRLDEQQHAWRVPLQQRLPQDPSGPKVLGHFDVTMPVKH